MNCLAAVFALLLATASWSAVSYPAPPKRSPAARALVVLADLPRASLVELRHLYRHYAQLVQRKNDEGWRSALLSGEIVEQPEESVLPARQLEESLALRRAELADLNARLGAAGASAPPRLLRQAQAKAEEIRRLKRELARPRGTCLDWSDAVWHTLSAVEAPSWTVRDQKRGSGAFHTAAVLCAPASDPLICLAFDPWERGQPDVFEFTSWDQGSTAGRLPAEFLLHHLPEEAGDGPSTP